MPTKAEAVYEEPRERIERELRDIQHEVDAVVQAREHWHALRAKMHGGRVVSAILRSAQIEKVVEARLAPRLPEGLSERMEELARTLGDAVAVECGYEKSGPGEDAAKAVEGLLAQHKLEEAMREIETAFEILQELLPGARR